ncbi:MAG: hypothetical protein WBL19_00845 [Minisyncoccia bacterium]
MEMQTLAWWGKHLVTPQAGVAKRSKARRLPMTRTQVRTRQPEKIGEGGKPSPFHQVTNFPIARIARKPTKISKMKTARKGGNMALSFKEPFLAKPYHKNKKKTAYPRRGVGRLS